MLSIFGVSLVLYYILIYQWITVNMDYICLYSSLDVDGKCDESTTHVGRGNAYL